MRHITYALLGMLMLLAACAGAAAQQRQLVPVFHLNEAEFVVSDAFSPPGENAGWRPTHLPDDWYRSRPAFTGVVWYRLTFDLPGPGPYTNASLYFPRLSARFVSFFLNDQFVVGVRKLNDARALNWDEPVRFAVSAPLFKPGRSTLYVRVDGIGVLRQGLPSVTLGDSGDLLTQLSLREALDRDALYAVGGAAAVAGLLAFAFWAKNRRDSVMLWFAITAVSWVFMAVPWFSPRFGYHEGTAADLFAFPLRFAYAVPLLTLCLRLGGKRLPRLEAAAWLFTLGGAVLAPLGDAELTAAIITIWSTVYLLALLLLLAYLLQLRRKPETPFWWLTLCGIGLAVFLSFCDLGRWMGFFHYENPALAHYHVPVLLLAAGATIVDKYFKAMTAVERSNAELELRLAEKKREIEASYQRLREIEQKQVLAHERSRIMADMHDGVGASLIGLLGMLQSDVPQRTAIARRVQDALLELRLVVDSLAPVEGDLGVVLGSVRHRMREPIEESGVRFLWQVGELPVMDELTPRSVLAIQHIVLEAIANALRHSDAATITVETEADADWLRVRVLDDGSGFDPATAGRGRGLDAMQSRARALGGRVEVVSRPRQGTSVTLILPRHPPEPPRDRPVDAAQTA